MSDTKLESQHEEKRRYVEQEAEPYFSIFLLFVIESPFSAVNSGRDHLYQSEDQAVMDYTSLEGRSRLIEKCCHADIYESICEAEGREDTTQPNRYSIEELVIAGLSRLKVVC